MSAHEAHLRLPPEPVAPALARAGIAHILATLPRRVADDVTLLTSELVTNSVRHAHMLPTENIHVRIARTARTVQVEVADGGSGITRSGSDGSAEHGWGLSLVDRITSRWAIDRDRVWFEIDLPAKEGRADAA